VPVLTSPIGEFVQFVSDTYAQGADAGQDDFLFWGKVGWVAAVLVIGLAIWFFKVRRKQPRA
jgi:hypothetical protein